MTLYMYCTLGDNLGCVTADNFNVTVGRQVIYLFFYHECRYVSIQAYYTVPHSKRVDFAYTLVLTYSVGSTLLCGHTVVCSLHLASLVDGLPLQLLGQAEASPTLVGAD